MATPESTRSILDAMLNKTLFVVLRTPVDIARMPDVLEEHLHWAMGAERRGELFASGPFVAKGAAPGSQGGMSIVRACDHEEVRRILEMDPFVRERLVTLDIRQWSLMEGCVSISLRFSDRSGTLF